LCESGVENIDRYGSTEGAWLRRDFNLPSAKETTQEERYIQSEGARSRWLQPRETKMNILFWNIRGLSADGKRRQLSEL
jgi:hypothetical protein